MKSNTKTPSLIKSPVIPGVEVPAPAADSPEKASVRLPVAESADSRGEQDWHLNALRKRSAAGLVMENQSLSSSPETSKIYPLNLQRRTGDFERERMETFRTRDGTVFRYDSLDLSEVSVIPPGDGDTYPLNVAQVQDVVRQVRDGAGEQLAVGQLGDFATSASLRQFAESIVEIESGANSVVVQFSEEVAQLLHLIGDLALDASFQQALEVVSTYQQLDPTPGKGEQLEIVKVAQSKLDELVAAQNWEPAAKIRGIVDAAKKAAR